MQIHEITQQKIDEGLGSALGGLAGKVAAGAGALAQKFNPAAGFKAGYAQPVRAQQTAMMGKKVADIWANYATQLKTATPDPTRYADLYEKSLTAFVQKNLLSGQSINSATNKQEIIKLISDITDNRDNPTEVATLVPKLVQQATVSQQEIDQPMVKIVSLRPAAILQYRNVDYAQDSNGQWANQRTGRVPDESFQAFLDNELAKASGAPTPTTPRPAATSATPLGQNTQRSTRRRPGTV
jgi:hypothetical protein